MDPNATLEWIENALQDGRRREAAELRSSLRAWLGRAKFCGKEV